MKPNIKTLSISYLTFLSLSTFPTPTDASASGALGLVAPMGDLRTEDPIASALVHGCPQSCTTLGSDPAKWTQIHDLNILERCKGSTLFAFNIQNELDVNTPMVSCSFLEEYPKRVLPKVAQATWEKINTEDIDAVSEHIMGSGSCGATVSPMEVVLQSGNVGDLGSGSNFTNNAVAAVKNLASYMADASSCGTTILFSKKEDSVAALYAGADVLHTDVGDTLDHFGLVRPHEINFHPSFLFIALRYIPTNEVEQGARAVQVCDANSERARTIGLFVARSVDGLGDAQRALQTWASGECISLANLKTSETSIRSLEATNKTKRSSPFSLFSSLLTLRAECRAIQVASGDSCGALASRCGITSADFNKYNRKRNLCATLKPKQYVCCSLGSLPDIKPKPQADGTCATYTVQDNDNCKDIAAQYGLTTKDIETFNKATWGWAGCSRLQRDQVICTSKGNTPMPAAISNAVCGLQTPGTKKPKGDFTGFNLTKLNPCPLNACCSGWGFCGTTMEFCTESPADTGAPGAFKSGMNGCISNCGTNIMNNNEKPKFFRRVTYYEAYNMDRDCLNMDVREINDDDLTHVHFAFAGLTSNIEIMFDDSYKDQFGAFIEMHAPWKKILSFGGWAESTDAATFQRYKDVVKPENRERFANNVVAFVNKHKLDGIDFDWEYPGATDIPGVPGGQGETDHYLNFLKLMREKLGDKSLSIALPASYWYLKPFPVEKMAKYLDYFIYMTYDLHGQWDFGNKNASPGCANGNCLRSHVNKTETHDALAMITKAGVPANQVVVGVSSYGRSFGMADPNCTGPMCKFTGSFNCTNTSGYISNAELMLLSDNALLGYDGYHARSWHDDDSDSDIMVYGEDEHAHSWVAYMSEDTKAGRIEWVKGLNFGGVSDWAIDLGDWYDGVDPDDHSSSALLAGGRTFDGCPSNNWPDTLDELNDNLDKIAVDCGSQAVVHVLLMQVNDAVSNYKAISSGDYDEKFKYYAKWIRDGINDSLDKFMRQNGSKHMDCEWKDAGVSGSGPCTEMKRGSLNGNQYVTWKMRDEDGFYKDLLADYGIQKDWIQWKGSVQKVLPCNCPQVGENCLMCSPGVQYGEIYYNYPCRKDNDDDIAVPNPKTIIDSSIPNITSLSSVMLSSYFDMRTFTLDADYGDVATSFSMPVFMLQDATEQMKTIKKIGAEVEAAEKKQLIMGILTIVFMVIPFAGDAAAALGGAAAIARMALVIGEAGNAALSIADMIDDPSSAPFAIVGLLLGAGTAGRPTRSAFKQAADARRALSADKLMLFSDTFRRKDSIVQNIVKRCAG
ncbi:conserved hypothetical protein [Aspergillus terreus NIH2624]|uniref:chitinase n=1 Tax=Aspergillus terreus (strain NIH 2624 / FGSC A1156) TaxID=341663 RepID=Q0CJC0_ASPTN|nr:uncharacterized protein ATEG_06214 [Aspergillus terreus NIH2624]EAU33975.1 conserved hypothetical protein [Aspergillus terreus NIH2624]